MQRINLNGKDKAQETDVKVKSSIESRIEAADVFMEDLKVAEKFKADVFWTKKRIIKPKRVKCC